MFAQLQSKCTLSLTIGFLEKNRNTLSKDWLGLLQGSSNSLLKTLFAKDLAKTQLAPGKAQTVMTQYRASLEALMNALNQCQPFFIRCIKPNDFKQPNVSIHCDDAVPCV